MLDFVNSCYTQFLEISKNNQILAAALSVWGLTAVSFLLKDVPRKTWRWLVKMNTVSLTINTYDTYFEILDHYIYNNSKVIFTRSFSYPEKQDKTQLGYGVSYLYLNGRYIKYYKNKEDASTTHQKKETITLVCLGYSSKYFDDVVKQMKNYILKDENVYINTAHVTGGYQSSIMSLRDIDSVILNDGIKERVCNHIDSFIKSKEWYKKYGFPYRTGMIFHGPPGTGKTSLIKALATKYKRDIFYLNCDKITTEALMATLYNARGAFVVFEDFDTVKSSTTRNSPKNGEMDLISTGISLGELLNAIDGIKTPEDIIFIATTNYIEKLDEAMIRDGRFNEKFKLDYLTLESTKNYLSRVFGETEVDLNELPEKFTAATLQKYCLRHKNIDGVIKEIKESI